MEKTIRTEVQRLNSFEESIPVVVSRTFEAPIERIWAAWSKPDLIKQWWGPEDYSCPEARIEFREGGRYLLAMRGPDERTIWSGGEYRQISPLEKIVCTDQFMDEHGKVVSPKHYAMPGEWPEALFITIKLEKMDDDHVKMSIVHEGIPKEMHDECVAGWSSSFDKLQDLVESH